MQAIRKAFRKTIISPLKEFIQDSRAIGITLLLCTAVSLFLANSNWSNAYINFWNKEIHLPYVLHLPHSLLHWINDLLMTFFFFLVGMEIKRELVVGELSSVKKAVTPVAAAMGGMLVPALVFIYFNKETPFQHGWGIPMATDIAFSLGVASLLGNRVPVSLKIFLMALAIIDDLGAILVIALFYGERINGYYILCGVEICLLLSLAATLKIKNSLIVIITGLLLWYFVFNSGIHATLSGVILAMFIPVKKLEHYEHALHNLVHFIFLPLFALANTAIIIPDHFSAAVNAPLSWGIMLGLLIGKPLGITFFSWLSTVTGLGDKPIGVNWAQIFSISILGGIGFTMSIFITMLAFNDAYAQDIAKIAVLIASIAAMFLGGVAMYFSTKKSA